MGKSLCPAQVVLDGFDMIRRRVHSSLSLRPTDLLWRNVRGKRGMASKSNVEREPARSLTYKYNECPLLTLYGLFHAI
jgi:hypothetical protein